MLKDEIRKPYFIKLKEFLWEQGVKGVDDSSKSLKVYPARKMRSITRSLCHANDPCSAKYIFLVQSDPAGSRQGGHNRAGPVPWS